MDTSGSQQFDPDETLAGDGSVPADGAAAAVQPGGRIGRYVITAELGRGAMGVVYSAVDPELDRKVALKLLRPGRTRTARLREEAQALAKVSSPHVVAVYDVGTVGEGVFVAMEFVQGQTLAAWLAQSKRDVRDVLRVFLQAGRGLAAVHAAGLVHGDFKPANVMVDERGRARVLDFGLARRSRAAESRATTEPQVEDLEASGYGAGITGTPAYMSPEQVSGHELDAASDQFSFCVALWEALYGARPFGGERFYEIAASLLEHRPAVPPNRRVAPGWVYRALLRGLAREPGERWPSMDALLQVLSRDRARRWRLGALAVVVVGLVGGSMWQQQRAEASRCEHEAAEAMALWSGEREADVRAAIERTRLQYASDTARDVVQRIDDYAQSWRSGYEEICLASRDSMPDEIRTMAYGCFDRRRRALDARLTALVHEKAEAALHAAEAVDSLPPLGPCTDAGWLAVSDDRRPEDPETARAVEAIRDRIVEAEATALVGRYEAARDVARAAAEQADALGDLPSRAGAHLALGRRLLSLGTLDEARDALRLAYTLAVTSDRAALAADATLGLARLEGVDAGREALGREWAFHAAAHIERPGVPPWLRAEYHDTLGLIDAQGQHREQAIAHHERALAIRKREQGEGSLGVAVVEMHLAAQLRHRGDYERAWALQQDALGIMRERLGERHPNLAISYNNAAVSLLSLGRLEHAREYLERSQSIAEQSLPEGHPQLAYGFTNLARVLLDEGDLPRALEACDRALALREATLPPEHPHIGYTLVDRSQLLRRMGRYAEAHVAVERALAIGGGGDGSEPRPGLVDALIATGLLLLDEGRAAEALEPLERALSSMPLPADEYGDGKKAIAQLALARALWPAGDHAARARARALAEEGLAQLQRDPSAREGVLARDFEVMRRWVADTMDAHPEPG